MTRKENGYKRGIPPRNVVWFWVKHWPTRGRWMTVLISQGLSCCRRMALFLLHNALQFRKSRVFPTSSKLLFGNYDTCHNYEDVILDICLSQAKGEPLAIWQTS